MTTVGTGAHTYELVDDWARLPAGWTLGQTGIVTDARDRVYLFNRSAHPLIVLDRDGAFLTSWGEGSCRPPTGCSSIRRRISTCRSLTPTLS